MKRVSVLRPISAQTNPCMGLPTFRTVARFGRSQFWRVLILVIGVSLSVTTARAQSCCNPPSSEVSSAYGAYPANGPLEFMVAFTATLYNGYGTVFDGHYIQEATQQAGSNSCWYPGSATSQNPVPTGGNWLVAYGDVAGQSNTYGYDTVGLGVDTVNYFREGMYDAIIGNPCTFTTYAALSYECDASTFQQYWDDTLNIVLYEDHETVSRDAAVLTIYQ